jgi:hypothetical protein
MPAAFKSHLIVPPFGMNSGSFQAGFAEELCKQESARRRDARRLCLLSLARRTAAVTVDMGVRLVEILVRPRLSAATKGMRRLPQESG